MTVKVGDIVQYNGEAQRVMTVSFGANYVTFSESGTVSFPDLSVLDAINLEIVNPHQFESGDTCLIKAIPYSERRRYGPGWASDMDQYINQIFAINDTRISPLFGPLAIINGREFQTYHLEPVYSYDII